jgi:hypothetical protein
LRTKEAPILLAMVISLVRQPSGLVTSDFDVPSIQKVFRIDSESRHMLNF